MCVCVCVCERERERERLQRGIHVDKWTGYPYSYFSRGFHMHIHTFHWDFPQQSLSLLHARVHTHTTEFGEWETGRNIYIMYTCKFRSAWCSKRTIRIIKMQGELLWTSVLILLCHMIVYKAAFCGLKMFRQNLDRKTVEDTEVREKELIPFLKGGLNQL